MTGPDQNCRGCHFAQMRARRGHAEPVTYEQKAAILAPSESWWATTSRDGFNAALERERPRLRKVPTGREPSRDLFEWGL